MAWTALTFLEKTKVYVHCFHVSELRFTCLLQTFSALIHCL